jgi:RNA polymerase sigma factor (sigma-70 family)
VSVAVGEIPTIEELVTTEGLAVVRKHAKQFAARTDVGFDESDFVSLGTEVLMTVAPEYKPERSKFTTYVTPYVKGAMIDAVRRQQFELTVQEMIGQAVDREARRFSSRQPDDFEVVFDPVEVNQARYEATLSENAVCLALSAAAAAVRLMRQGTEDHLGALEEHRFVVELVCRTVAEMPAPLQRLWEVVYVEERSLREYVAELRISEATGGRYHKELKDRLRAVLLAEEITSAPDVE